MIPVRRLVAILAPDVVGYSLREADQQSCDANEHQSRSDAFERDCHYPGRGGP
jgi:hypothetical protein